MMMMRRRRMLMLLLLRKMVFIVQVHKFTLTVCCVVECRKRISSTE